MNIKNILIAGAGMMGKSIAYTFAANPAYKVGVYDVNDVDIIGGIRGITAQMLDRGIITKEQLEQSLARISFTTDLENPLVSQADMLVECVYEDMEVKRRVFSQLEQHCRTDCIFCTNTSVMSPSEISVNLRHRERFVGTHFWNPGHLIPLVEVVKSDMTDPQVVKTVMEVLEAVGKKPVLCKKDVPGFIANRLQHALWREAIYMVETGIADAKTVDEACKYGPGLRWPVMGPMENSDLVGIELTYNIHSYILKSLADNHEPSYLLRDMLSRGELGMKSGKGWQEWTPEEADASNAKLREYLIDYAVRNKNN